MRVCVVSMREYGVNVDKIFIHAYRYCTHSTHSRQQPHVTAITMAECVHIHLKDVVVIIFHTSYTLRTINILKRETRIVSIQEYHTIRRSTCFQSR